MRNILKGFGKYRVSTYCNKCGIQVRYFKTMQQVTWAVESNKAVWQLIKVQSRFKKQDILNTTGAI